MARRGKAWRGRIGTARLGKAGLGLAWQGRIGQARHGRARLELTLQMKGEIWKLKRKSWS